MDENKIKDLRNDKAYNLKLLQDEYNINQDDIEVLFKFAKFLTIRRTTHVRVVTQRATNRPVTRSPAAAAG